MKKLILEEKSFELFKNFIILELKKRNSNIESKSNKIRKDINKIEEDIEKLVDGFSSAKLDSVRKGIENRIEKLEKKK